MPSGYAHREIVVGHHDAQALRLDRFDVRGPLIDDRDVTPGLRKIGGDAAADGTGAEKRDSSNHASSSAG
jgi:hypothetical protein